MMKTKFNLSAYVSKLCMALLTLLGYGCGNSDPGDEPYVCMYGTPTGSWEVKGKVTEEAATAVPAATIKVTAPNEDSSKGSFVETQVDENGEYIAQRAGILFHELKVVCIPDDESLEADSTVVRLTYHDRDEKDHWDVGTAEATVNFKLKKKKN